MIALIPILTLLAALGSGLMAGLFFAFSSFVMAALARLPADQGITAMNSINVTILNLSFSVAFFGTTILCLGLGVVGFLRARIDLARCRKPALPDRHDRCDDDLQRATE